MTLLSSTEATRGGGECSHCLPIKPEEGSLCLCPLSGQDVGRAEVARSGITGPGRQEPDPGACLNHCSPPKHSPFCSLGSSDTNREASVLEAQKYCFCWEACPQSEC